MEKDKKSILSKKYFAHLVFFSFGTPLSLPLLSPVQISPPASPSQTKLLALSEAPFSDFKIYVITFLYPISLAILAQAPYRIEQALYVPSVHNRLISKVSPSSKYRDTGLPQIATPHSLSFSSTHDIENLCPTVGL